MSWSRSTFIWVALAGCLGYVGIRAAVNLRDKWNQPTAEEIAAGELLFRHEWSANDPLAGNGDGLGPVFNARSCATCHFQGGVGGGGTNEFNVTAFEVIPTRRRPQNAAGVVHAAAIHPDDQESVEDLAELFPPVKGGTAVVDGESVDLTEFDPVILDSINTTALFGAGLIDKIPARAITMNGMGRTFDALTRSFAGDQSSTPVGRIPLVAGKEVGRFGWRGQFATLEQFVATACAVELGLSNPCRQQDEPGGHRQDEHAELDLTDQQLRELVSYVASLPRPRQILPTDARQQQIVRRGEQLFADIGCAVCHTPDVGEITGIYSDFRLYDVDGQISEDGIYRQLPPDVMLPSSHPEPSEWRTPPLWGVADSAPYFHDGGSPTLESAILRHGVQARHSSQSYQELSSDDQVALLRFLGSLRAPRSKSPSNGELASMRDKSY